MQAQTNVVLKQKITLKESIIQIGNLGGLISGLYTSDYNLISRSLHDEIVEPLRSILIPGFDEVKENAIDCGALGAGISGSGPSIFALSQGEQIAEEVARTMSETYENLEIDYDIHVSKINTEGCRVI